MDRKVAVFGGSFNPPHVGHLMTCQYVLAVRPDVDKILVIPTFVHPFGKKIIEFRHRLAMCERMVECIVNEQASVTDIESHLSAPSYTVNTLRRLRKDHPSTDWAIIVGSDLMLNPEEWRDFSEVQRLAEIIVVNRFGWKWTDRPVFADVSSTTIREKLNEGKKIDGWVPSGVLDYINENNITFE